MGSPQNKVLADSVLVRIFFAYGQLSSHCPHVSSGERAPPPLLRPPTLWNEDPTFMTSCECVCAKLLQSCLTLCDPMDCSLAGSAVCGILQARILLLQGIFSTQGLNPSLLHWQADSLPLAPRGKPLMTFSSVQSLSHVRLSVIPWTAARQASLSITSFRSLLIFMYTELVMPSNHLILCCPLLFLPSIFPNESVLRIRWPKDWSFSST